MNRILLLLAGSGLSEREIMQYLRELVSLTENELLAQVAALRGGSGFEGQQRRLNIEVLSEARALSKNQERILDQISQMLRQDTGLTVERASRILLSQVKRHVPPSQRGQLPSLNKESFSSWLEKLSTIVPMSVLLHEAARIRNKSRHASLPDWPLEEK